MRITWVFLTSSESSTGVQICITCPRFSLRRTNARWALTCAGSTRAARTTSGRMSVSVTLTTGVTGSRAPRAQWTRALLLEALRVSTARATMASPGTGTRAVLLMETTVAPALPHALTLIRTALIRTLALHARATQTTMATGPRVLPARRIRILAPDRCQHRTAIAMAGILAMGLLGVQRFLLLPCTTLSTTAAGPLRPIPPAAMMPQLLRACGSQGTLLAPCSFQLR
eukprot:Rmarinus@m.11468